MPHIRLSLLLFAWLCACDPTPTAEATDVDPSLIRAWVTDALDEAALHAENEDWPAATDALLRAHQHFDRDLEPVLRGGLPEREVIALEYRFALAWRDLEQRATKVPDRLRTLAGDVTSTL